jgi:hypothetical protein
MARHDEIDGAGSVSFEKPVAMDIRRQCIPRPQGFDATDMLGYECPLEDARYAEVWFYTDRLSYRPGDTVCFHASSTVKRFTLELIRDGSKPCCVKRFEELHAPLTRLRSGFIEAGCDWPVVCRWRIPSDAASGFIVATACAYDAFGAKRVQEHGFFVRPIGRGTRGRSLLVGATSTWTAYNDWGGANHYHGDKVPGGMSFAPRLSIHRPWARGLIWLPEGAPRNPHDHEVPPGAIPRYPPIEFAFTRGFSKWYANAGWATYERNFAVWAENNGYALDYASQQDLHNDPHLLDGYGCVVFVGHDEYWTWEMREAVDRFVEQGGNVLRCAGNFFWQIRFEDGGNTQVCYKSHAHSRDPLVRTESARRMTGNWEDPVVGWPGAQTFGLNASGGMYAHVGSQVPRSAGGFTVYRPDHWTLSGTDLYYGDVLGARAKVFGYEVDGLDYTFHDGLPYPTYSDGAPKTVEIIAMGMAYNREIMKGRRGEASYYHDTTSQFAKLRYGSDTEANREKAARGCGMMITFTRGAGTVFHAGSCEWVAGLKLKDAATETVTRNVLDRFTSDD